ncbi:MAG: SIS domain-containing protein [Propionibacteriales bacterium]|nr:SIS domain-containing protein [Propionibacteriales bacterium]
MTRDRELITPGQRFGERLGRPTSAESLQQKVHRAERDTLELGWQTMIDDGSAITAAGLVAAARRRFVTGAGKSYALAYLLVTDLSVGLAQVQLVDAASGQGVSALTDVRPTDVLVAISLRRYRPETAALAGAFAERGGRVVAITDAIDSPVGAAAEVLITVPTTSASHVDTVTAVVSACHLLTTLAAASAKGARRRIADRELITDQLGLYPQE